MVRESLELPPCHDASLTNEFASESHHSTPRQSDETRHSAVSRAQRLYDPKLASRLLFDKIIHSDYSEVIYCSRIGIRCPSVVRRKTALYDVGVQHHDLSMFRMMSDMDDTPRMRRKNPVPWPALRGVWPREGRSEVMRRYPSGAGNQRKPAGVPFVRMRELAGRRAQSITGPAGGCNFGATTAPDRSPAGSEMGID
ncbi:hypothetical protein AXG93_48s1050 [Marchantia polymorpha subsp. ruderalis]|uniref:Uncharacterized protein n=1 Tax=Marchantia polymorpha subsp. ruderalis TaxID=1480154 RepID=A0A176VVH5_MARPO|nr:hypothetical protein AXG93_48s1050 [Marchantia polymorpha subsp. ruderalis]